MWVPSHTNTNTHTPTRACSTADWQDACEGRENSGAGHGGGGWGRTPGWQCACALVDYVSEGPGGYRGGVKGIVGRSGLAGLQWRLRERWPQGSADVWALLIYILLKYFN